MNYDFCGWATKNDLKCADGRIIRKGAFKVQDGAKIPLVWNHNHTAPSTTLGHAILENRDEGVYAYCSFNNSKNAEDAKEAVKHGDVTNLSIWANNLEQIGAEVIHGTIREVSLVLAGANPGAFIESVMIHGEAIDEYDQEGLFYTDDPIELHHAADSEEKKNKTEEKSEATKDEEGTGRTIKDVFDGMTQEQKEVVAVIVSQAVADSKEKGTDDEEESSEGGNKEMKHNVFDKSSEGETGGVLSHSAIKKIFDDAKRTGSLREAVNAAMEEGGVLAHGIPEIPTDGMETAKGKQTYGFNDPDMLFPDFKTVSNTPEWLSRNMDWVSIVMGEVHHTPFSRIKSVFANITEDEARARGYIKGKQKKEEVFSTLKRTTSPQTIYKKQKMDRDDIIDITDFDTVAWIKAEMRVMLNEEIARAILIGDGRLSDSDDKISEDHIRPIATDKPLFNTIVSTTSDPEKMIDDIIAARKHYKGSGNPTFFTTEDVVTSMLLLKDKVGHRMYKSVEELATELRVKRIVTVEVMENATVNGAQLFGIIVNLSDYNVGADKGGAVEMFDDFDIDFNQFKYLIETRCSGALIKPFSALTIVGGGATGASVRPTETN